MFNQVSANIAAQKQAGLFEEGSEDFALVSQDLKGNDINAGVFEAVIASGIEAGLSPEDAHAAAIEDFFENPNNPGSRHHY